jgi:DNA-binding HxlR family transcriptional regulator
MALPKHYPDPNCSLVRSLEVVGERWTLLIIRDAFYGVRRFGEFAEHLGIPRAVLTDRLNDLVDNGVLTKSRPAGRAHSEYELTETGRELWPIVYGLIRWGDEHLAQQGAPRVFEHAQDGGRIGPDSTCEGCGRRIDVSDIESMPGPGMSRSSMNGAVGTALLTPHRMLEPLIASS